MGIGNILILGTQDRNLLADIVDRGRMPLVRVGIAVILLDTTATTFSGEQPAATNILQIAKASCYDLLSMHLWIELGWVGNSINDHR
jgi:hypothetical protein